MTTVSRAKTFLDALADAIEGASAHNRQDQEPPATVLWPDKDRQWEALLSLLKNRLPLFVLGNYSPDEHVGPAYWLRCIIAPHGPSPRAPTGEDAGALPAWLLPTGSQRYGNMPY